jgi:large subunit ribosomal protein L22
MADTPDVRASARFIPVAPQKVRLVVDLIRGRDATQALQILRFERKAAARPLAKLLRSAIANAEENYGMSQEDLLVSEAYADEGPTRRWRRFGARGRFKPILRRTSHITVVLREREKAATT